MSRKFIAVLITAGMLFSMMFFLAAPALAISNGVPDGNEHPNVGALFAEWNYPGAPAGKFQVCSGVLIAPTVFLTAGHCFPPPELIPLLNFYVTFDSQFNPVTGNFIMAQEVHVNPEFGHDLGDLHDLAVVILLEDDTTGITPAELPTFGMLGEMSEKCGLCEHDFVNVGYGVVPEWKKGPTRFLPSDGLRRMSTSPFMALTKSWLKLLMNNDATDQGGVCYGDSGGPHFLAQDSDIVAAITTGGDTVCRALNFNYRLDTESARGFLCQFVTLP